MTSFPSDIPALSRRSAARGFSAAGCWIPHTKIRVNKIAPMGDPMELFLRGYTLTLRKEDAHNITIEEDAE